MDIEKGLGNNQAYEARGIIGRFEQIGEIQIGLLVTPVYKYITLDCGKGRPHQAVEFVEPAPRVIDEHGTEFLDIENVPEGHIIINPGLMYKKIEWTGKLHAEHLIALQGYISKDIVVADAPDEDEGHIDLGEIDFTQDQVTKH